ncbi:MAG: YdcF family protein [Candidatus Binataceae bacterium]
MFAFVSKILGPLSSPVVVVCALLALVILSQRRRPRLARAAAVASLLIMFVASNAWFAFLLTDYLESRNVPRGPLPTADAIVVLSSNAQPALPPQPTIWVDEATVNRLLYGVKLYREGKASIVILSGGQLPWLNSLPPMSQTMAEFVELMGVPKSAVIQELASGNTYENALDVKAILQACDIHKILLVTSALHMPRALALFKHQGIDTIAAPCDFFATEAGRIALTSDWRAILIGLIPEASNLTETTQASKELLGLAVYHVMGLL